jgi:hypothetical protein
VGKAVLLVVVEEEDLGELTFRFDVNADDDNLSSDDILLKILKSLVEAAAAAAATLAIMARLSSSGLVISELIVKFAADVAVAVVVALVAFCKFKSSLLLGPDKLLRDDC